MQVAHGIHHFPTGPFNCYVIEENRALTLVDGGFPGIWETFVRGLATLGYTPRDVRGIVLTHAHADHMGIIERVREASGAPVFVHEADAAKALRVLQLPWWSLLSRAWHPYVAGMLAFATWNGVFTAPRIRAVQIVKDEEILDIPGRPRVLHLPGHTPGEIGLHLPDRAAFFSGDALLTRHLFTGAHGEPQIAPRALESDGNESRRSIARLNPMGRTTLLPGHGRPWEGDLGAATRNASAV